MVSRHAWLHTAYSSMLCTVLLDRHFGRDKLAAGRLITSLPGHTIRCTRHSTTTSCSLQFTYPSRDYTLGEMVRRIHWSSFANLCLNKQFTMRLKTLINSGKNVTRRINLTPLLYFILTSLQKSVYSLINHIE